MLTQLSKIVQQILLNAIFSDFVSLGLNAVGVTLFHIK